ncbi:hypothetical protein [Haloarcula amylolytica]|uniref:hypothetical protein n=1 Tax=Haloarcula amylolytica TaxID=396317 RepID=UPI000AA88790|nr:hypothetical protein [Haloarcula amylolytica]
MVIELDVIRMVDNLRHEYRRGGEFGLLDSLAYRAFYRPRLSEKERSKLSTSQSVTH